MRRLMTAMALVGALSGPLALPAQAQDPATLVADHVFLTGDNLLTAEGAVEVYHKGVRLTATRIIYDGATERLTIEGPIALTDETGTVILADSAEMSRDLTEGVMTSARVVLDQQLQIASTELTRTGGRYTRAARITASSCQVCPNDPVPLWEIRAHRVIHDQQERQLYFDGAQFRVAGVPVMYFPYLRVPDPTLKRATGFLIPSFRTTTSLGAGLKLPYFIALGDSRDLTLTPYLSTSWTRTLEFRYREALTNGHYEINGGVSRDDIRDDDLRGYLFADGAFALPRGFKLDFSVQEVSDDAYLLDYGLPEYDILTTGLEVSRTRRNEYVQAGIFHYWSLRDGDDNNTLPTLVGDFSFARRFSPQVIGGEAQFSFDLHSQRRSSHVATDTDGDGMVDGRDMTRASALLDWHRQWTLDNGMVLSGAGQFAADQFFVTDDDTYPSSITRVTPTVGVELRWPWVKATAGGASHVLEPVAQVFWSPTSYDDAPNEDSNIVNLDDGNLFGISRFPGMDARELGARMNVGLGWTRYDPAGWSLGVTAGRVLRADDLEQFSSASGLDGKSSDWLVAAEFDSGKGLSLMSRTLFDDGLDVSKEEIRVGWATEGYDVSAGYLWLVADPAEGRVSQVSELVMDAAWDMGNNWSGVAAGRYDFDAGQATRASFGVAYRTECATVNLSLSRRFTSSTSVNADTDINLSVVLNGLGAGADGSSYRRSCSR